MEVTGSRTKVQPLIVAGIPPLQRGQVWKRKAAHIELLWDSIFRGFPIGCLVVCPKLEQQHPHEENNSFTHDLLDGQQRAYTISLGFNDPFSPLEHPEPILWLDLHPELGRGITGTFLFRLTTEAHPWGYTKDDNAAPIALWKIREALKTCGFMNEQGEAQGRPKPAECWPFEARVPVPVSWLLVDSAEDPERFWSGVQCRCEKHAKDVPDEHWSRKAAQYIKNSKDEVSEVWKGIQRALKEFRVPCLVVPEEVIAAPSWQETDELNTGGNENIANVEHLFQRLNAGGMRLEPEELAYSMLKAHWPELKDPVEKLARKRMPEARLVSLAARVATAVSQSPTKSGSIIPRALSVSDFRRLKYDKSRKDQRDKILAFIKGSCEPNLNSTNTHRRLVPLQRPEGLRNSANPSYEHRSQFP